MALGDYARLALYYNGNPLEKITSLEMVTNSGLQRVDLLNEGFAGFTPGSGDVQIDVGFVVPADGTEDTFQEDCANLEFVTLQMPVGRKDYIGKGKILSVRIGQSTGASVAGSFSWLGEPKPLE